MKQRCESRIQFGIAGIVLLCRMSEGHRGDHRQWGYDPAILSSGRDGSQPVERYEIRWRQAQQATIQLPLLAEDGTITGAIKGLTRALGNRRSPLVTSS